MSGLQTYALGAPITAVTSGPDGRCLATCPPDCVCNLRAVREREAEDIARRIFLSVEAVFAEACEPSERDYLPVALQLLAEWRAAGVTTDVTPQ